MTCGRYIKEVIEWIFIYLFVLAFVAYASYNIVTGVSWLAKFVGDTRSAAFTHQRPW